MIKFTFLGTAAAGGTPLFGCNCTACDIARKVKHYTRRPASAFFESDNTKILIDAGLMDIHERFDPQILKYIVITHFHPDHIQGLFHLRWGKNTCIEVFCPPDRDGLLDLYKNSKILKFYFTTPFKEIKLQDVTITPLPLFHSKLTYGYYFESKNNEKVVYLVDCKGIPEDTKRFLKSKNNLYVVIDATYPPVEEDDNHNNLDEAIKIIDSIAPEKTFLTHISHSFDDWLLKNRVTFPDEIFIAYDNYKFCIE